MTKPLPMHRETFIRTDFFGIDSIQGVLEFASWYDPSKVQFGSNPSEKYDPHSFYSILERLAADGYIRTHWAEPTELDAGTFIRLDALFLTPQGADLLETLRGRSRAGRLKRRFTDLWWIVATAAITAYVTVLFTS